MDTNVVKPAESDTSVTSTPSSSGSPASPAASLPKDVKPQAPTGAPATGAGDKPADKTVPIEALHEERGKRQALDTQLSQLKALFGDKFTVDGAGNIVPIGVPASTPPPQQGYEDVKAQLDKAWDDDPRKAVGMEMLLAIDWYDKMNSSIDIQKDSVRTKYRDFNVFEPEVNKYIKQLPISERGKPGSVELAYLVARGQKHDSLLESEKTRMMEELTRKFQAGELTQGIGGGSMPAASGGAKPTNEQVAAAAAMGMTVDDYMKYAR